jgi:hypothetical protein
LSTSPTTPRNTVPRDSTTPSPHPAFCPCIGSVCASRSGCAPLGTECWRRDHTRRRNAPRLMIQRQAGCVETIERTDRSRHARMVAVLAQVRKSCSFSQAAPASPLHCPRGPSGNGTRIPDLAGGYGYGHGRNAAKEVQSSFTKANSLPYGVPPSVRMMSSSNVTRPSGTEPPFPEGIRPRCQFRNVVALSMVRPGICRSWAAVLPMNV